MKPQAEFKLPPRRKLMSDINVVPYIDVMLVLLVVFMVTAPMMTQGIKVDLPDADAKPINLKQDEPLVVSVRRDGNYHLNVGGKSEKAVELVDVVSRVGAVKRQKPETLVLVEGDDAVPYGQVVKLMAALQQAGVADVGLVTEPAPVSSSRKR
ncbi:MAG: protein TolR [Gammaproteobacteria bacterium]